MPPPPVRWWGGWRVRWGRVGPSMKGPSAPAAPGYGGVTHPFQPERSALPGLIDSRRSRGYNHYLWQGYPSAEELHHGFRPSGMWPTPCRAVGRPMDVVWRRSFLPILILNMRSAMNRIKLCSGGLAASLMVVVAASAVAQGAGEWTMAGRTYDLQRYSPLTQIR